MTKIFEPLQCKRHKAVISSNDSNIGVCCVPISNVQTLSHLPAGHLVLCEPQNPGKKESIRRL
eukprot:scaffold210748_cov15-Prasinocladus_malaysianus.AAC.1